MRLFPRRSPWIRLFGISKSPGANNIRQADTEAEARERTAENKTEEYRESKCKDIPQTEAESREQKAEIRTEKNRNSKGTDIPQTEA